MLLFSPNEILVKGSLLQTLFLECYQMLLASLVFTGDRTPYTETLTFPGLLAVRIKSLDFKKLKMAISCEPGLQKVSQRSMLTQA